MPNLIDHFDVEVNTFHIQAHAMDRVDIVLVHDGRISWLLENADWALQRKRHVACDVIGPVNVIGTLL
jgi:hypothetical protein